MAPRLRSVATVPAPQMQSPDGWTWDGANWTCDGNPSPPGCPPAPVPCPPPTCKPVCPPVGWPEPCPPFYPPPSNQPPWYPGANGGVTFSQTAPPCPIRGAFWYDGRVLWLFDGAGWVDVGVNGISSLLPGNQTVFIGSTAPVSPAPGKLWWNGTELQLWDGVKWNFIGPTAAPTPQTSGILAVSYYGASQAIVIPPSATKAYIQMWGASGGSGGVSNASSGGTGAGGYLEKFYTGLTPGNTMQFTCGQGGQGGAPAAGGQPGTVTTLTSGTQSIGTLICNSSQGSMGATGVGVGGNWPGSPGGTSSGGDISITGQTGGDAIESSPGNGGETFFGKGADGLTSPGAGTASGLPGNPGGVKITWYA